MMKVLVGETLNVKDIFKPIIVTNYVIAVDIIDDIKPYLRPMSSMTEEEREEYKSFFELIGKIPVLKQDDKYFDFLNCHHFDYRGLITKGLAIEAPKDMYAL